MTLTAKGTMLFGTGKNPSSHRVFQACNCLRNGWSGLGLQKSPQHNKSVCNLNVLWTCELGLWLVYVDTKGKQMGGLGNTHVTSVIIHTLLMLSVFNHPYNNYISVTICYSLKIAITVQSIFLQFFFQKCIWTTYSCDPTDLKMPFWVSTYVHQLDI